MKPQHAGPNIGYPLAEDMVKAGLITASQLAVARVSQQDLGEDLGWILVEKGFVTEAQLLEFFAQSLSLSYVSLKNETVDLNLLKKASLHLLKRCHAVPLRQEGNKALIAMADPLNMASIESIKNALHMEVETVLASASDIDALLQKCSGGPATARSSRQRVMEHVEMMAFSNGDSGSDHARTGGEGESLEKIASGANVVMAVNEIIARAFEEKASDIHLEPTTSGVRVRYRVDGFLEDKQPLPVSMLLPIVSRLKILSGMDIAERRAPQDGRMRLKIGATRLDLRLSTYPTLYGEKVVMRLLMKDQAIDIESMGFTPSDHDTFTSLIKKSHGIFLVTGPTGSGKSTTLYAGLSWINSSEKNIISIEDPIESEIAGVNQAQINHKAGVTFAAALRSILRQDPDIIMIGEIRDGETAQMAVRAAITGHLVLSTLHTNTASGAISRLIDLGVEPFLLSSALIGVLAQRLVRKICPSCRKEVKEDSARFGEHGHLFKKAFRGEGCSDCRMSGYSGRMGIFEMAPLGEEVRKLVNERASDGLIEAELRKLGVKSMLEDGIEKINAGITTVEEILRVTQEG
jgi:type IV pilus assembly protein PilB